MDFNDIKARLSKTLSSMNEQFSDDILGNSVVIKEPKKLDITFSNKTDEQLHNRIFTILYNLASLKDHSFNALVKLGLSRAESGKRVEGLIDGSLELCVLMDLVNQEKHGYPLQLHRRSNLDPLIKDISEGLMLEDPYKRKENPLPPPVDEHGNFDMNKAMANAMNASMLSFNLDGTIAESKGNHKITISANVYDLNNNLIFSLDKMIETCYDKFYQFLAGHGVI